MLLILTTLVITVGSGGAMAPLPDHDLLSHSEHASDFVVSGEMLARLEARDALYGYDVDHYHLDLAVNFTNQTISGTGTMSVTITEPDLQSVPVDINNTLTVTAVTVNGSPVSYGVQPEQITVSVGPTPPSVGAQLDIAVGYNGHPQAVGTKSMRWGTHNGIPYVYTLSTPYSTAATTVIPISHYWRPCKDAVTDKSTYSASLTVPDDMIACTDGLLISTVNNGNGTKTYHWEHDFQVAPYLITIGVTNFVELQDEYVGAGGTSPIRHYAWPERVTQATAEWAVTPEAMGVLAGLYGEYPFLGDKYGMYITGTSGPAVEHQTMTSMPTSFVPGNGSAEWVVVHELAHMWWGDAVTVSDWDHVWLSEGFASYAEAQWFESSGGAPVLQAYMQNMSGPFAGTIVDPPYVWDPIVYDKGAWILHMLRHIMGDVSFQDMLRGYQADHRFGHALTDDFVAAAEAAQGADLSWFFDPWLYQQGQPTYDYTWWFSNRASAEMPLALHLDIEQVQSVSYPTYKMPIDVDIVMPGGTEHHVVWDSLRTQSFEFPVPELPSDVVLDPRGWILAEFNPITPNVPGASGTPAAFLAQNAPNPVRSGTVIAFGLSRDATVALRIYDVHGRLVRTLHRGRLTAGEHEASWDGLDARGAPVPSGRYFYRLVGPDGAEERQLVVVR